MNRRGVGLRRSFIDSFLRSHTGMFATVRNESSDRTQNRTQPYASCRKCSSLPSPDSKSRIRLRTPSYGTVRNRTLGVLKRPNGHPARANIREDFLVFIDGASYTSLRNFPVVFGQQLHDVCDR